MSSSNYGRENVHQEDDHPSTRMKRGGLGRGLSALIPESQTEDLDRVARPIDILLPPSRQGSSGGVARGGSARELLTPSGTRMDIGGANPHPAHPQKKGPTSGGSGGAKVSHNEENENVSRETFTQRNGISVNTGHDRAVKPSTDHGDKDDALTETTNLVNVPGATFADIPITWIVPNTRQPRTVFDEDELHELSASIKEVGVLQPIVVRPILVEGLPQDKLSELLKDKPDARYELIMGERRLRASELAGEDTIPAIIRHTDDEDLLRDALLENLHRSQLNAIEEAAAYAQLMEDFGATQEQLSKKIARSRPQIANTLRLLKLPTSVQRKVAAGVLTAGHARALLGMENDDDMEIMSSRIVSEGLSVRTTEEIIRLGRVKPRTDKSGYRRFARQSENTRILEVQLSDLCDTRVNISEGSRKGKIVIEFAGSDDLNRICAIISGKHRENN